MVLAGSLVYPALGNGFRLRCGPPQHPSRWGGQRSRSDGERAHRTPAFLQRYPRVSVRRVRGEVHLVSGHRGHLPLEHPYEGDA
jgi:hypothetical protein